MSRAQFRETLELMGQDRMFYKENWEGRVTRTGEPAGVQEPKSFKRPLMVMSISPIALLGLLRSHYSCI